MTRALFSVWCLGNSQKSLTKNQFLVSTVFFTSINISFFSPRFDLFSIIAKKFIQIRNNVVCVLACLVFVFCCAVTTGRCNTFQHIFKIKRNQSFTSHISRLRYFLWLCFYWLKHITHMLRSWFKTCDSKQKNTKSIERQKTSFLKEYVGNADTHKPALTK